jgi:hypothetical protein
MGKQPQQLRLHQRQPHRKYPALGEGWPQAVPQVVRVCVAMKKVLSACLGPELQKAVTKWTGHLCPRLPALPPGRTQSDLVFRLG